MTGNTFPSPKDCPYPHTLARKHGAVLFMVSDVITSQELGRMLQQNRRLYLRTEYAEPPPPRQGPPSPEPPRHLRSSLSISAFLMPMTTKGMADDHQVTFVNLPLWMSQSSERHRVDTQVVKQVTAQLSHCDTRGPEKRTRLRGNPKPEGGFLETEAPRLQGKRSPQTH